MGEEEVIDDLEEVTEEAETDSVSEESNQSADSQESSEESEVDYKARYEQAQKDAAELKAKLGKTSNELNSYKKASEVDKDFKIKTEEELQELIYENPVEYTKYVTDLAVHNANLRASQSAREVKIKENQDAAFERLKNHYKIDESNPEKLNKIVQWMDENGKSAEELTPSLIDYAYLSVFPEEFVANIQNQLINKKKEAIKEADITTGGGTNDANVSKFPGIDVTRLDDEEYLDSLSDEQLKAIVSQDEDLADHLRR